MAGTRKVYRVVVSQTSAGWRWQATDAQGRVTFDLGKSGYTRKADAVRGARRACGANVRIAFA